MTDKEHEERIAFILDSPNGIDILSSAIITALEGMAPIFVFRIKGKAVYDELDKDVHLFLEEELAKGRHNLYNRLRDRIDHYWEK